MEEVYDRIRKSLVARDRSTAASVAWSNRSASDISSFIGGDTKNLIQHGRERSDDSVPPTCASEADQVSTSPGDESRKSLISKKTTRSDSEQRNTSNKASVNNQKSQDGASVTPVRNNRSIRQIMPTRSRDNISRDSKSQRDGTKGFYHSSGNGASSLSSSRQSRSRPAMVNMDGSVRAVIVDEKAASHRSLNKHHEQQSCWQETLTKPLDHTNSNAIPCEPKPFKSTRRGSILIGIVFLATFGGVFMSVVGTLGCEFLGYNPGGDGGVSSTNDVQIRRHLSEEATDNIFALRLSSGGRNRTFEMTSSSSSTTTSSSTHNADNIDNPNHIAWIGIFAYQSTAFGEIIEEKTAGSSANTKSSPFTAADTFCVEYDNEYFFGNAPFKSLYTAQVCAILAPTLCLIGFLLYFLDFADICNVHKRIRLFSTIAFLMFLLAAILQALCLIVFLEPELCEGDGSEYACAFGTNAWLVVASAMCFFVCAIALLTYYWLEEKYYFSRLMKNDFNLEDTSTDTDSSGNGNFNLYDGYRQQPSTRSKIARKKHRKSRNAPLHPTHPAILTMQKNIQQKSLETRYLESMEASVKRGKEEEKRKDKGDLETGFDDFVSCQDDFDFVCGADADGKTVWSQ